MINAGHYVIDSANEKNIFFMEFVVNPARYAIQINTYQFPYVDAAAITAAGFSAPSNFIVTYLYRF